MTPITFLEKQPRKFFYKKPFKRKVFNNNALKLRLNKANVQYNYYGLRALESGQIKYRQVEAVRKVFLFFFREESNLLIKLQFNSPIISRSLGVRMGRGKGKVSHWVANVKKGQIVFELSKKIASYKFPDVLQVIRERIPIKLRIVKKKIF